ncbi:hypothetical protein KNO81_36210 [Paraburkholderia sediminicola]|nr:hypothetical protein [Paraburkholderia sediminicola]
MIKRDRPFGSEPGVLQSDSATNEQKRASDYYAKEPCGFPAFDAFRVYRDVEVKKALRTIFEKKCAYCESKFVNQGVQVEHFRPKGGVQLTRDPASTIGYWWLASEWTNLLPACSDCNTVTKHFLPDGSVKKLGKGNYFPLLPGQGCAPSRGFLHLEVPLLVDPTYDDPRRYLEFSVATAHCLAAMQPTTSVYSHPYWQRSCEHAKQQILGGQLFRYAFWICGFVMWKVVRCGGNRFWRGHGHGSAMVPYTPKGVGVG